MAYVSDSNMVPYRINSEWSVWVRRTREWSTSPLHVRCVDDQMGAGSAAAASARGGLAWATATVLAVGASAWYGRRER